MEKWVDSEQQNSCIMRKIVCRNFIYFYFVNFKTNAMLFRRQNHLRWELYGATLIHGGRWSAFSYKTRQILGDHGASLYVELRRPWEVVVGKAPELFALPPFLRQASQSHSAPTTQKNELEIDRFYFFTCMCLSSLIQVTEIRKRAPSPLHRRWVLNQQHARQRRHHHTYGGCPISSMPQHWRDQTEGGCQ